MAESGLHKVSHWLRANLLTLNLSKSTYLQFHFSSSNPININIKQHVCNSPLLDTDCSCLSLTKVAHVKYLGILVDEKLSWRQHIDLTSTRIRKLIWAFKKLRHVADLETLRRVYFALVQSVLGYCIVVWGGACKTFMIRVERAQRSLLKVITFRPFIFPTAILYEKCGVLTVRQTYILQVVTKQHVITPFVRNRKNKRTVPNVCIPLRCHTASARRQRVYLAIYLYNMLNKTLNINPHRAHEAKQKVKKWLQTQDYGKTENLLP